MAMTVRTAYSTLVRHYHPDTGVGSTDALAAVQALYRDVAREARVPRSPYAQVDRKPRVFDTYA